MNMTEIYATVLTMLALLNAPENDRYFWPWTNVHEAGITNYLPSGQLDFGAMERERVRLNRKYIKEHSPSPTRGVFYGMVSFDTTPPQNSKTQYVEIRMTPSQYNAWCRLRERHLIPDE